MIGYCVEYDVWYMEDSKWNSRTEYRMCFSLIEAERLAETLRWNQSVNTDSVHIRLMTDKEYEAVNRYVA